MMTIDSCRQKQKKLKELFLAINSQEKKYEKIMEMGKKLKPLSSSDRCEENRVHGCQSTMYLKSSFDGKCVHFQAESNALISSGLAALLLTVYDQEEPETILQCSPDFLEEIGLPSLISPARSNGLYSLHLLMKQRALSYLVEKSRS
jgi:cysteine desulfuration protein SufE